MGGQIKKSWEKVGGQIEASTITRTNKNDIKKKQWYKMEGREGKKMSPFSNDGHAK